MNQKWTEWIRSEWRDLGFYYDRNDDAKEWRLVGSRAGLLRFPALLRTYADEPRNLMKSEHEHFGPHMHLEVMTWPEFGMDGHAIHGTLDDLRRLATIVEEAVRRLAPGDRVRIRDEFTSSAEYVLILELRDDGFDPASADGSLVENAG